MKMNKAFAAFTTDLALETVDKLFAFLGEKVELDEDWTGYFDEFKAQLKTDAVPPKALKGAAAKESKAAAKAAAKEAKDAKPKRAPTAYNTFIGQQMALLKESNPTMNAKDRMKEASAIWKATNGKSGAASPVEVASPAPEAAPVPVEAVPAVVAPKAAKAAAKK